MKKAKKARGKLRDRILSTYPSPIARACRELFRKKSKDSGKDVVKIFNLVWTFLGIIILADYIRLGSPSNNQNLRIISSIRSMNAEKWMELFKSLIPFLGEDPFIPELIYYFRSKVAPDEEILPKFERFRKRMAINYVPTDKYEVSRMRNLLFKMLDDLIFLSDYPIVSRTEVGTFILRGISEMEEIKHIPGTADGDVGLLTPGGTGFLALSPFIVSSNDPSGINFVDFKKDVDSYRLFLSAPEVARIVKEYKRILMGLPDFSAIGVDFPENPPFSGLTDKLEAALANPLNRRILIEGHPGSGKTMLIARLEKFVDTSKYTILKYYMHVYHLLSSAPVFCRFFYVQLNNLLDRPHRVEFKGEGWQKFQKLVTQDFEKSGKNVILAIDSIDLARYSSPDEKFGIPDFLQRELPSNLRIIMTGRSGDYPHCFDTRIQIPELKPEEVSFFIQRGIVDTQKLKSIFEYYEGSRGYIYCAFSEETEILGDIPRPVKQRFIDLLFRYNLFQPVKEKICRYLAEAKSPCSLEKMAEDLEIYKPVILNHLSEIMSILETQKKDDTQLYRLFIPSFAKYISSLARPGHS